eukprot:TRINITY_DN9774_c0_g1_i3.p1 TRINITY_DN9774_c0_g1~~TRINITY_DN9774_c0_g1_i3.p1  ORF type:complete len:611 (+),score=112.73 TRINITY_DN9774_c0_g1_i3:79-1911(+)
MEEVVRVRLLFEDRHLLSKSQKREGLKHCWLLLNPQLTTISHLESHLLHKFHLQKACPNGLLLSMDGFVLPPFESTCICKDKDIIRVKKKDSKPMGVIRTGSEANDVQDSESMKRQPMLSGMKLLAIEGFEKEPEAYQREHEENQCDTPENSMPVENSLTVKKTTKRKRKHSNKLLSSKRKKTRSSSPREYPEAFIEEVEKDVHTKENKSCHQKGQLSQSHLKVKEKSSNQNGTPNVIAQNIVDGVMKIVDSTSCEERDDITKDNGPENRNTSQVLDAQRKFPSRSSRRKKARRQWLWEIANSQSREEIPRIIQEKEMHTKSLEHQPEQHLDGEDDIVPIVVRPGHIRFEPLDDAAKQGHQQLQQPVATLQWNGPTSKKKGQKWGKEKPSVCRRNDDNDSYEEYNKDLSVEEGELPHDPVDFEKLMPLSCLLKEADVIAYRLVELSSSWCPELSSFRVGKITSYDPVSGQVILVPVPGYPIISNDKRDEEDDTLQSNTSLYKEDGSLEVNFSELIDVRTFSPHKPDQVTVVAGRTTEAPTSIQEPTLENGEKTSSWEEISQALNAKKAQLLQKDGWSAKENPVKSAWSYKAMRGSALGPTMALLRSQNNL